MATSEARLLMSKDGALAMAFREYLLGNLDTCPSTGVALFISCEELERLLAPWSVRVVPGCV